MAKRKPLPTEINGVKVISDCGIGYLHTNSKSKVRIAMVECPDCKEHRKVNIYALKNADNVTCPKCANVGTNNGMYKHGEANTSLQRASRTHRLWNGIKARCYNPNNKDYPRYGGRGITMCTEWQEFVDFKSWAGDRFEAPDSSIERIEVNGNYCAGNCMVIPTYLQAYNRRNGMDLHTAVALAKSVLANGKIKGYILFYMSEFPSLKDYQIKQFVLYSKHIDELAKLQVKGV